MAETLAVIALLGWIHCQHFVLFVVSSRAEYHYLTFGRPRMGAVVALMAFTHANSGQHSALTRLCLAVRRLTRLLAVVAQALTARAHLGVVADVAALVACAARQGRHLALLLLLLLWSFGRHCN